MIVNSVSAEEKGILDTACAMCVAARTAPKACGIDRMETAIVIGEDKDKIAEAMRDIAEKSQKEFFARDADNVDASSAIVLIGMHEEPRKLDKLCQLCHFEGCAASVKAGAGCVFDSIDLGIAIGSAVAVAADCRVDNRVMYTIGKGAAALGILGDIKLIMGIPLSVSGKSPYFDR